MNTLLETAQAVTTRLSDINARLSFQEDWTPAALTSRTVLVIPEDINFSRITRNTPVSEPVVRVNVAQKCASGNVSSLLSFTESVARRFENLALSSGLRCTRIECTPAYSEKLLRESHIFYAVIRLHFTSA